MNTQFPSLGTAIRTTICGAFVLLSIVGTGNAQAANFSLSGNIAFQKDVVQIDFSLANAASDVKLWTDSWASGLNFDPSAAVWKRSGTDYNLLADVDDNDAVAPGQGFYDSGIVFSSLAAGDYRLTLVAAGNLVQGSLLSQGFLFDNQAAIALTDWNQPSYDPNKNDQKGGFWRANFSGVDQVSAVPEPASVLLMLLGIGGLMLWRQRAAH
jgi:PEP-CTERM motif